MALASVKTKSARGLNATLQVLGRTHNEAAAGVLVAALDSPLGTVQEGALRALLARRGPAGKRDILSRLHRFGAAWREILASSKGRLTHALREAITDSDAQLCANACQAVLWCREYDLVPVLLAALETDDNPHAQRLASTVLSLAELLHDELSASPRHYNNHRDPQLIRHRVAGYLEASLRRYGAHERPEVIQAFLFLTHRDNVTLKQILQSPRHGTFAGLIGVLLQSNRPTVIQLLLSYLDDPHAPAAALMAIARRHDAKFIEALLHRSAHGSTPVTMQNLRRIESFAWLRTDPAELARLDEQAQQALVPLAVASGVSRHEVFTIVETLLRCGAPAGRVAAARGLANFDSHEADALVLAALDDPDPRVQAAVLPQIRERGIPDALARLLELVDSPHECVRQSARESLAEFRFERFATAFDSLDDEARITTGNLVRRIHPESLDRLVSEMRSPSHLHRLRALAMSEAMGAAPYLETTLIELLHDEEHLVRNEAARALRWSDSAASRAALLHATSDRSITVRETARYSLSVLDGDTARQNGGGGQST